MTVTSTSFSEMADISLADLEAIRLLLRGGSVIDWHRLNFKSNKEIDAFLRAQELDMSDPTDVARVEAVKQQAVDFLRRHFEFPIPKGVSDRSVREILALASGAGHKQLCACTILKAMHIIHHLEARELAFMLPKSDEEVFHLVEKKVYRVIGSALANKFPVAEFIGGRKHKDSLYTKLLSKPEVNAAQIYDKLRFRIVMKSADDVFPMMKYLTREVFPFNYAIPGESTNTLFNFRAYCQSRPDLERHLPGLQLSLRLEEGGPGLLDNVFTSANYKVIHFVVDMPIRLPDDVLSEAPPAAWALGKVIFVLTEFQIIDERTDQQNELGDASHAAYKDRQKLAVMRRLKVGIVGTENEPGPGRPTLPPNSMAFDLDMLDTDFDD